MSSPIRVLTAVPICDGHDSAINTINLEFIRHGIEVVYLGFHRYVGDIVRAAIQEEVTAIEDSFAQRRRRRNAGSIRRFGPERNSKRAHVLGFTGPGGAGKTTLIDELVLRFLQRNPKARIAILSHDPSVVGEGALLGD